MDTKDELQMFMFQVIKTHYNIAHVMYSFPNNVLSYSKKQKIATKITDD